MSRFPGAWIGATLDSPENSGAAHLLRRGMHNVTRFEEKVFIMNGLGKALALVLPLAAVWTGCITHHADPPITDPAALTPPAAGSGFQIKTDSFEIAAGVEEQDCYFFKVGDVAAAAGMPAGQPVNLHRVQIVQKEGSHHMNIFRVRSIKGLDPTKGTVRGHDTTSECFKSPNWSDWPLVANTQQKGDIDWTYPDGVANVLQADEWLMLQTHYVNATTQKVPDNKGAVSVNFYALPQNEVKYELGTVFASKQSIRICSKNPTPTFEGSCQIKSASPVTVIGANGHFHGRGKEFAIYSWDGKSTTTPAESQRFYTSQQWDDPPMLRSPSLTADLPANGGIWYSCSYQWAPPEPSAGGCDALNAYDATKYQTPADQQDCCYTFGPIVEKNEHCNAFVYYYPKQDNIACN